MTNYEKFKHGQFYYGYDSIQKEACYFFISIPEKNIWDSHSQVPSILACTILGGDA